MQTRKQTRRAHTQHAHIFTRVAIRAFLCLVFKRNTMRRGPGPSFFVDNPRTANCDSAGEHREPKNDKPCSETIKPGISGFCECTAAGGDPGLQGAAEGTQNRRERLSGGVGMGAMGRQRLQRCATKSRHGVMQTP